MSLGRMDFNEREHHHSNSDMLMIPSPINTNQNKFGGTCSFIGGTYFQYKHMRLIKSEYGNSVSKWSKLVVSKMRYGSIDLAIKKPKAMYVARLLLICDKKQTSA